MKDSNNISKKLSSTSERIEHIDMAKAIGMILIIFSHIWIDSDVAASRVYTCFDSVINSFYVPLFFLLSGVFDTNEWTLTRFVNRSLTLTKYIIIFSITGIVSVGLLYSKWDITSVFRGSLCWFLITLLWINVLNIPVRRYRYGWCLIACYIVAGYYITCNSHSLLYFGNALVCYPFFALGYIIRRAIIINKFKIHTLLVYWGGWFIIWFIFYSPQNLSLNQITQPYMAFYSEAILGSLGIVELSKLITCRKLIYFGKYSIIPMWIQMPVILVISLISIPDSVIIFLLTALMITSCCWIVIPIFQNNKFSLFSPIKLVK